ncbi:VOC family protein [Staphylococcus saccharolyticus]|uniref:ABC transporter-like protein n=1 Tax=Staphylococcus saccharolyticus TaxID=33028 RepID=A0A380H7R6_9STAP|nr:VOC family protein [Staphylococcus saccharolyticus]MBL7565290.1 VOC family protein [Staphylococcus saccharolyticus]MBL7571652.1 VOC family protein [Staphylococcus saccharolyticus]QQB98165.1 VOC family protein [Staphylococcus saccharolyticus]QRJ65983.1 VOC family protein [Staphylococcus saccharolyticus]RTX95957.1 VOC family protein [Staphylococcus saccharolyticus]
MSGLRSVTIGTRDLSKTKELFSDIIGLQYTNKNDSAIRFGDANLSPGTRIHFVEIPDEHFTNQHIESIGLRTPSDSGLLEYQGILSQQNISYSSLTELNGLKHFSFEDHNHQKFDIYSDEHNTGIGLGIPSFESSVNPLHQVQGLGPVIIKVNELPITTSILIQVFGLDLFAEYLPHEEATQHIHVFKIGEGGLGGELHLYEAKENIEMADCGPIEQVEFATKEREAFNHAKERLDDIGIPYQTLEQDDSESLRITENSGISFIYTLEK